VVSRTADGGFGFELKTDAPPSGNLPLGAPMTRRMPLPTAPNGPLDLTSFLIRSFVARCGPKPIIFV